VIRNSVIPIDDRKSFKLSWRIGFFFGDFRYLPAFQNAD